MSWSQSFRSPGFADLADGRRAYPEAGNVILPVPYERTTSWGSGTYLGPHATLLASQQLELYDEELGVDPSRGGVHTLGPVRANDGDPVAALDAIRAAAREPLADGKFLVSIGGEHTVTLPLVEAALETYPDLGVLQFDAHADLRETYDGTPLSHACVMRRVRELGVPTAGCGIRSLSEPEAELIRSEEIPLLWGHRLAATRSLGELLTSLPEQIYLTFDVDFLDPGIMPATGTPEPGGYDWYGTLALLREVFAQRTVVAMDVVELAPSPELRACDFLVAKLAYKCIAYRQRS